MNPLLLEMLHKAKDMVVTQTDWEVQAVSFAYGNARLENDNITEGMVRKGWEEIPADEKVVLKDWFGR